MTRRTLLLKEATYRANISCADFGLPSLILWCGTNPCECAMLSIPGLTGVRGAILCDTRVVHPIPVGADSARRVCSSGNIMPHRVTLPRSLLSDRVMKPTRTRCPGCGDVSP